MSIASLSATDSLPPRLQLHVFSLNFDNNGVEKLHLTHVHTHGSILNGPPKCIQPGKVNVVPHSQVHLGSELVYEPRMPSGENGSGLFYSSLGTHGADNTHQKHKNNPKKSDPS